ncbi:hypothetical protein L902_35060 [Agrobacterium radiobacter DSM 30147]|nr:hypothetical protein L902_35060 [Agrobacterium radiobacter DSM 30147]
MRLISAVKRPRREVFIHRGEVKSPVFLQRNITTNDKFTRFSDF